MVPCRVRSRPRRAREDGSIFSNSKDIPADGNSGIQALKHPSTQGLKYSSIPVLGCLSAWVLESSSAAFLLAKICCGSKFLG
jgi:hypothetical protein